MATLKPQSNGPSYSNTVIGTLAVDGWAVTFGTARRGLSGLEPAQTPPRCTKCNSPPINGHCTSFISFDVVVKLPMNSEGLTITKLVSLLRRKGDKRAGEVFSHFHNVSCNRFPVMCVFVFVSNTFGKTVTAHVMKMCIFSFGQTERKSTPMGEKCGKNRKVWALVGHFSDAPGVSTQHHAKCADFTIANVDTVTLARTSSCFALLVGSIFTTFIETLFSNFLFCQYSRGATIIV